MIEQIRQHNQAIQTTVSFTLVHSGKYRTEDNLRTQLKPKLNTTE